MFLKSLHLFIISWKCKNYFLINCIEEINIKSDVKKIKYQISKSYCKLLANSLAMITQFLKMSINKIMMLLCENVLLRKLNKSYW